ncbi:MAG TPA: hypothetical protein VFV93_08960 [Thermomicrobiales bacterium]|nr:hypothetical protein [Thermomicrobiales bacterium]
MNVRRLVTAGSLGLLALMLLVMPAAAGVSWCRADPIVELNGTPIQVWVAVSAEHEHLVSGPIQVMVFTSDEVDTNTTYLDDGFNGYGEEVTFRRRNWKHNDESFPVEIKVKVPLDNRQVRREFGMRDIPILIEIITGDGQTISIEGRSSGASASMEVHGSH